MAQLLPQDLFLELSFHAKLHEKLDAVDKQEPDLALDASQAYTEGLVAFDRMLTLLLNRIELRMVTANEEEATNLKSLKEAALNLRKQSSEY